MIRLEPSATAVVAIDMHRGHLDPAVATLPLPAQRCGPVVKRAAALFAALRTRGFGFDVELLLRAQRAGYRIAEVPVNWTDQAGSKVGVLTHGPRMLIEILRARLALRGEGARRRRR